MSDPEPEPNEGFVVRVPDISRLSDAELQAHFPHLDGAWSAATKRLLARFKVDRLNLNDNWAMEGPAWRCPACQRYKPDIARVTGAGVLLCQLDRHHDHLGDYAKRVVRARNPLPEGDAARGAHQAIDATKGIVERFYPTVVCNDCNTAEGRAKRELAGVVHPDFSFSPEEIRQFVVVRRNQPHDLNVARAREVWEAVKPMFERELAFADLLAERVALGHHRKAGHPIRWDDAGSSPNLLYALAAEQDHYRGRLSRLMMDLSIRSTSRHGLGSTGARSRPVTAPTDMEFAKFDAAQGPERQWRLASADWCCPACSRDRRAIVRKSNAGAWTGQLFRFATFVRESDPVSRDYRADEGELIFGAHRTVWLCQDCREIVTKVATLAPQVGEGAFTPADLAGLITAGGPNQRHAFDLDAAVQLGEANAERQFAAADYRAHQSRAMSALAEAKLYSDYHRIDFEDAVIEVAMRRVGDDADPEDAAACLDELRWLIAEARRLRTIDRPVAATARPGVAA